MIVPLKRILIVDDDPAIVGLLSVVLEYAQEPYAVGTASNGGEALQSISGQRPDLVLLDLSLPDMNGLEVLQRIRQTDPSISVIMMTGAVDDTASVDALRGGAFAYVPKPFNVQHIEHLVASALATGQASGA
jgi:DNA-binding response OmpR family regulator